MSSTGALAAWAAATAAVAWRELRLPRASWQWLAAACAVLAWTAASWLWSDRRTQTVLEVRRTAVYAAAVLALVVLVRRSSAQRVLVLTHTAIVGVVAYALARYLIEPRTIDPFEGTLLSQPLGYANALAALAAIGVVLGVGLAAATERALARAALAAPVPVLAAALPLTQSRGAAVALAAGLAVVVLCTDDASPLVRTALVIAPGAALAAIVSAVTRLGDANATPHAHAAWLMGVITVACVAGTALAETRLGAATRSDARPTRGRRGARLRNRRSRRGDRPDRSRARRSGASPGTTSRRTSRAGRERARSRSAWIRSGLVATRGGALDAHSLYLETLAELGAVGLVLLLAFLALPLAWISRSHRNAPIAAGAYVVFLVHAGLDWDWEMPAVVSSPDCAARVSRSRAARSSQSRPRLTRRALIVMLALVLAALSIAGARSSSEPVSRRGYRLPCLVPDSPRSPTSCP